MASKLTVKASHFSSAVRIKKKERGEKRLTAAVQSPQQSQVFGQDNKASEKSFSHIVFSFCVV